MYGKINLNGVWAFGLASDEKRYSAKIPSCNFEDLIKNNLIEDPFYKKNEEKCQWVGDEDFCYERTFEITEDEFREEHIVLNAKMLDTLCDVFVNGQKVGEGKNAYIGYEFDIKNAVTAGENKIKIIFHSPVKYVKKMQEQDKTPHNCNGIDGVPHIRKPACHFGWDWGPVIPLSGIVKDIFVECFTSAVRDFSVSQEHSQNFVALTVTAEKIGEGELSGFVESPDDKKIPLSFEGNIAKVEIENPSLWWTKELSGKDIQPLYTVTVSLGDTEKSRKIGLRTLILNRENDEYGANFQFVLNGVPIFAKGANYIPPDSVITRFDKKTQSYYIDSALKANFNMLRVWGGGYYESDEFYSECDEKGLLIWQDFCFACLMYPFYNEKFLENVKEEIKYNVKRLCSHPSLALWCGNNEIEFMFQQLPESMKIVQWYKKFFYEILPDELRKYDAFTPFIETSPIGKGFRQEITKDGYGDTHMWHVWHGSKKLNYYRTRFTRFCSEYGMESLPSMDAVNTFADKEDFSLYSDVFLFHQKCNSGNGKMLYYLYEQYNKPKYFEDLIYFTQLVQMRCISEATEHWRRNKGRCNGSLWWQYNDCWPAPSWSSVDYTGKWKALQYEAAHFNAPLTVSVEDNKDNIAVFLLNDTLLDAECKVEIRFVDFSGKEISNDALSVTAKSNSSEKIFTKTLENINKKNTAVAVTLFKNGKETAQILRTFLPDRKLKLKKPDIKLTLNENKLTLLSDTFARNVFIDIKDESRPLSDNFFSLLPNEEKTVILPDKNISANRITVKSVASVETEGGSAARIKFRTAFSLKPINIGNRIYYSVS